MALSIKEIAQAAQEAREKAQEAQKAQVQNPIGADVTRALYGMANKKKYCVGGRTFMMRVEGEASDGGIFDLEAALAPRKLTIAEFSLNGEEGQAHLSALMGLAYHFATNPTKAVPPALIKAFGAIPLRLEAWATREDERSYAAHLKTSTATAGNDGNDDIPA